MAHKTPQKTSQTKKFVQAVFPIRFWLDSERIKSFFQYVKQVVKRFFVPQPKASEESFEAAKERLKLTDEMLLKKQRSLYGFSILLSIIATCLFGYAVYLILSKYYLGASTGFVVSGIAWMLAFRYHFWHYQIKQKKLGCSVREWLYHGLLGGKAQ